MENSTALVKVQQMPVNEIMSLGKQFSESGFFSDIKSVAQAIVKIQAGQEIGIPPFASIIGIHVIQGKPTIGAGLIASRVKSSGKYDYEVIELTDKNCEIDFYQGKKKIGTSTFNLDDAKKAGTKNLEKFPKNMLFARAISNGVKFYCPDIFSGPVYVPEEFENFESDDIDSTVRDLIEKMHLIESTELLKAFYEENKQYGDKESPYFRANFVKALNVVHKKLNPVKPEETPKQALTPLQELKKVNNYDSLKRIIVLYPKGCDCRDSKFEKVLKDKLELYSPEISENDRLMEQASKEQKMIKAGV